MRCFMYESFRLWQSCLLRLLYNLHAHANSVRLLMRLFNALHCAVGDSTVSLGRNLSKHDHQNKLWRRS